MGKDRDYSDRNGLTRKFFQKIFQDALFAFFLPVLLFAPDFYETSCYGILNMIFYFCNGMNHK